MSLVIIDKIIQYIERYGFITIDQLMHYCMSDIGGYYRNRHNIIGEQGDFITAPEISQIFGEIIGLWVIEQYQKLGRPTNINLIELGPGKGTLTRDCLRVCKLDLQLYNALQVYLLEINPTFKILQKNLLNDLGLNITWIKDIKTLPPVPTVFIANEFFDALPIKQYIKLQDRWYEQVVIINCDKGNKLEYGRIPIKPALNELLSNTYIQAEDHAIVEKSPQSSYCMDLIATHIEKHSGSALIIDYGYNINPKHRTKFQYNSTLQAIKNHNYNSILESLGEADMSAHVDFYSLIATAQKHNITNQLSSQRRFLLNYGILLRRDRLKQNLTPVEQLIIDKQVERLISPYFMGEMFKILSIFRQN